MARKVRRNVNRAGAGGRQALVRRYNTRQWYELPDWAVIWISDNVSWMVLALVFLLTPVALLAAVLGVNALPLEYIGVPLLASLSTGDSGAGLNVLVIIVEFILLVMAIRPLRRFEQRGWVLLIAAAAVHLVQGVILQHAISAGLILAGVIYLFTQVRHRYVSA